ncbi:hypothetical protein D3C78_1763400 [compost metagenome]
METAKRLQGRGLQVQLEFFQKFTLQGLERAFAGFALAAGQHQCPGTALAHQQQAVVWVQQAGGGDIQGGHGVSVSGRSW